MQPLLGLGLEPPTAGARNARRTLYAQLRDAIVEGRLAPGLRLPASRELAMALGVSRNTVVAIYELLLSEGYLVARVGAGTFVTEAAAERPDGTRPADGSGLPRRPLAWRGPPLQVRPLPADIRFNLRLGAPDVSLFPFDTWSRLCARAERTFARAPVPHSEPQGRAGLREAIAAHLSFTRAVACGPEDIVVTAGAQQAFNLLARVLVREGDVVAVEDPGYPFARAAFQAAGARIAPTPVDADGLDVDALPADASVIYTTPSHQFPLGVPMSLARRRALLGHAARSGAVVIEDDYDGEFRFDGRPVDALRSMDREGRVFYVGTFSKCMFPALRMGFIAAPGWARPALTSARQVSDWHGPVAAQDALAQFIAEGHLARHIRRMQRIYAQRRAAQLAALASHCGGALAPLPAVAGLHFSARLTRPLDGDRIAEEAERRGLAIDVPRRDASGVAEAVALSYALVPAEAMDEAVALLAEALAAAGG
jgi:GntR family transcriptional regulator/MocR family aminotransferase